MPIDLDKLLANFSEPQLQYQWDVILPSISGASNVVHSFAQEVSLPHGSIDAQDYHRSNTKRYDPGFTDVEAVTITFVENMRGNVINYLYSWKALVVDDDGFYGSPNDYKQEITIRMLDAKGTPSGIEYQCEGVWPSTIAEFSLGHESAILQPTCTFSCDNIKVTYPLNGSG